MDVILHLGAHRSASTTFQAYVRANRGRLAQRGLTSWTPKRTRDGLFKGLMRHPALVTAHDMEIGEHSVATIRHEVARLDQAGQAKLLISEENLLGTMRNNVLDGRLYPVVQARLDRVFPAFDGARIKIGLCVRSLDAYWTSCLAQLMARGADQPRQALIDCLATQPRNWRDVVQDIAAAAPQAEIVVWPFERMANAPASVLENLWAGDQGGFVDQNRWLNRRPDIVHLNKMMALRGDAPLKQGVMSSSQQWLPFSEDQRRALREDYRRDIAWLSAGADGLARFVDGWPTSATRPDRAEDNSIAHSGAMYARGQDNGIEERMGRTRAG